jgi:hypothetical protein
MGSDWRKVDLYSSHYKSYSTFHSVADTIISGQSCRKIIAINKYSPIASDTIPNFMYSDSNRVYFMTNSNWYLLYDFNVQSGDSFLVGYYNQWVNVLSVDTITVNGFPRKHFQYAASSMSSEFSGPVIEGIGHVGYMFPTADGEFVGPLRCYEDNVVGLYKSEYYYGSTWSLDCDQIITGLQEQSDDRRQMVFPSPFSTQLTISSSSNATLILYDIFSRQILQQNFTGSATINTAQLAAGIYFYELRNEKGVRSGRVMKE